MEIVNEIINVVSTPIEVAVWVLVVALVDILFLQGVLLYVAWWHHRRDSQKSQTTP